MIRIWCVGIYSYVRVCTFGLCGLILTKPFHIIWLLYDSQATLALTHTHPIEGTAYGCTTNEYFSSFLSSSPSTPLWCIFTWWKTIIYTMFSNHQMWPTELTATSIIVLCVCICITYTFIHKLYAMFDEWLWKFLTLIPILSIHDPHCMRYNINI